MSLHLPFWDGSPRPRPGLSDAQRLPRRHTASRAQNGVRVDPAGERRQAGRRGEREAHREHDLRRKGGRFDHLFVERRKRAPAITTTAIPATKTQSPHQRSRLTRPTTMRIAETTAIRVRNGWAITRDGI